MKLIIEGSPKKIAALALEMQRRPETIIVQNSQMLSPSELVHQFQNVQRRIRKVRQSDFASIKGVPVPKANTVKAKGISGKSMNVKQHMESGRNLSAFMGDNKFHSACKEIASTITANNLDATPGVLKDLLDYVANDIAISRI